MKTIFNFFILLALFSCGFNELPEPSMEKELLVGDFLCVEKLNYGIRDITNDSLTSEQEINKTLKNDAIDDYFKQIFFQEKLVIADDLKMLSITDSLFTSNINSDAFFFVVFTKSMNGADGFYSESLGSNALDFISKKTEWFCHYFITISKLSDKDLNNWADYIYGEIQISDEGNELKSINKLEATLLNNIKMSRKDYKPVIEKISIEIKSKLD